jgi:Ca2+-binding RTX toxin-like protein
VVAPTLSGDRPTPTCGVLIKAQGTPGDDILRPTPGGANDVHFGFAGNDKLFGGGGDDALLGGAGNDSLFGGVGNDFFDAEVGRDFMKGGAGADQFRFGDNEINGEVTHDSGVGNGNRDRISDFDGAEGDVIALFFIDADVTTDIDDDFVFVGDDAVGKGELGYFESGGSTIVRGNTDNDAASEFEIQLDGVGLNLSADDFSL